MEIASDNKVLYHGEKLRAFLNGQMIYPATLELDITSRCTMACFDCPSSRSSFNRILDMNFISRLFADLEGRTRGLLLTGGEPTMAPHFSRVLSLARTNGFVDIAVVTNGSLLNDSDVVAALLRNASTIRVSLYGWNERNPAGAASVLKKIESLRKKIDQSESSLQIGISLLTSAERTSVMEDVTDSVRSAGAHWVYFHPLCKGWKSGRPERVGQRGVLDRIVKIKNAQQNGFQVFTSPSRYRSDRLRFKGYHAAHFLLVIGADGLNYLGAEVKYQPRFAIADAAVKGRASFLLNQQRLERIKSVDSLTYPAISSRHRGVLYNHRIEAVKRNDSDGLKLSDPDSAENYKYPHIL